MRSWGRGEEWRPLVRHAPWAGGCCHGEEVWTGKVAGGMVVRLAAAPAADSAVLPALSETEESAA